MSRIEIIQDTGYGLIPRRIMRDENLSVTAKCIYSYLASFAGNTGKSFPSTSLMAHELGISKNTLFKYLKELKDKGIVTVERERNKKGIFEKNIYYLHNKIGEEVPCTKKPYMDKPDMDKPYTVNEDTNSNNLNNNNPNSNNHHHQRVDEEDDKKEIEMDLFKIFERAEIYTFDESKLIEESLKALFYRNKPYYFNSRSIPVKEVRENLKELRAGHLDIAMRVFEEQLSNQVINNRIGYLSTCIYTALFDADIKIRGDLKRQGII